MKRDGVLRPEPSLSDYRNSGLGTEYLQALFQPTYSTRGLKAG